MTRWAWAEVDLDAIAHNVRHVRDVVAPAEVWAVVKADGYGHGAVDVARAALGAGASGLCVALTAEGVALRDAGIDAPVLVLSEQPLDEIGTMVANDLTPTLYSRRWLDALASEVGSHPIGVHVKVDTGMQRVGATPDDAVDVIARLGDTAVRLDGVYTHLAVADEPSDTTTRTQLDRFDEFLARIDAPPLVHAANSAAALAHPASRRSFVRLGIAMYGISPGHGVDELMRGLRPGLSLRARVSFVKPVRAGSRISYGHRHEFASDTMVATLPIGYADGVPRRLAAAGGQVLVAGQRCPIVGVVTMDQLMVDVGDVEVAVGDEAVLIGAQGDEHVRVEEWADRLGTIGYEIVCGISRRVPRVPPRSIER